MNTLIREKLVIDSEKGFFEYFNAGCKNIKTLGVEYEKLVVQNRNFKAAEFFFNNGILDFLIEYKKQHHNIPSYENSVILGLISNKGTITLEPGCQTELSLVPLEKIDDIKSRIETYNKNSHEIAKSMGLSFLSLGIQPVSTYENIKVIPKNRYRFMTKYFQNQGSLAYSMMRETAGIQVSIDYSSEEDAILKLSTALKLSPFMTAMFANSPIRNSRLSGYKSFRANSWLNTDNKRCGLISSKLLKYEPEFSFEEYAQILLDVPMIFNRDKFLENKTFRDFFKEKEMVFLSEWKTHLSLFFPDVRLKNYIEIRNHDCQKLEYALAIPAIYKGIMYSKNGMEKVKELLKDFDYYDYEFMRQNAPRFGIDFRVKGFAMSFWLEEIFKIANEGLIELMENEQKYLIPVFELLDDRMTPADIIIRNFEGSWNRNIEKLIKFSEVM